jgi:DNA-directed RNA polymerase specialized sigma24 family protein
MQRSTEADLIQQCKAAIDRFTTHYGWQLIDADTLAQRALDNMRHGCFASPAAAVMGAYCVVLYNACTGSEGADRQNRAYQELGYYLFSLVRQRYRHLPSDDWEDVTQSALERVCLNLGNCREPIAFLMFAAQQLLDAVRHTLRRVQRAHESLDRTNGDEAFVYEPVDQATSAFDQIVIAEDRQTVTQLLDDFVIRHPRAWLQILIVRESFLLDMEDAEIADRHSNTRGGVYSAKSRGLKALRDDPVLRAAAECHELIPLQQPSFDIDTWSV